MLANDVMSYSDYYSYHAHIDSGRGLKAIDYPQGKALGHVIMANAYNNDKPVWMNEGGISIPVDENNVANHSCRRRDITSSQTLRQWRWAMTSAAGSDSDISWSMAIHTAATVKICVPML